MLKKSLLNKSQSAQIILTILLTAILIVSNTTQAMAEELQQYTESATIESSKATVVRNEGSNRANVAVNVAKKYFFDTNKVILVNQTKFPDAISATNISQGKYPVLYTYDGHVQDETIQLLQNLQLDEIYILGGTQSINETVVNQLKNATNVKVTRITGNNRYTVNVNAIKENYSHKEHVVIAGGSVYADALYGVPFANTIASPVVLTRTNGLDDVSVDLLKELGVKQATIIGGPATVSEAVENQLNKLGISYQRIYGENRYIGSAETAKASYFNPKNIVIASGEVFSDALVSAPLAQKLEAPILLVQKERMREEVSQYLIDSASTVENVYIQGGTSTVSLALEEQIKVLFLNREQTNQNSPYISIVDEMNANFDMNLFNQLFIGIINQERARVGVDQLVYQPELQLGTDYRTYELTTVSGLSHTRPNGTSWDTVFDYLNGSRVYEAGENIAYNSITGTQYKELSQTKGAFEKAMAELLYVQYADSPPHYENMIYPTFDGMAVSSVFANPNNNPHYVRIYNTMIFSKLYNF